MTDSLTPRKAQIACLEAISAKDVTGVIELTDSLALFEIPMLKPNRLHGHGEIRRGLEAAFQELTTVRFSLDGEPGESGAVAIAAGSLAVSRLSAPDAEHAVGIVTETQNGLIARFSLYLNARNRRLWSDAAIL